MKTYTARTAVIVVLAASTMVGSAFAGQTQADRERDLLQRATRVSPLGWQERVALETGNFPVDRANQRTSEGGVKTGFPIVEIGGIVYRIGIDTK